MANPKKPESKGEVIKPLAVEVEFPSIMDVKQAIATDSDGNLIIAVQFKAQVNQYEVFRLVNLLKQQHGTIYAKIGSPQAAMDFKFDPKQLRFDIFTAEKQKIEAAKPEEGKAQDQPKSIMIQAVAFNHIPEEEKPFGVAIDYSVNGSEDVHTVGGRGMNPTEAVMAGVKSFLPGELAEPFEVSAALEQLDPSPECYKLIRVIEVGSFDDSTDVKPDKGKGSRKKKSKDK